MLRYDGFESMASRFGIIKVTLIVDLQAHSEFMKMLGNLMVVVQALVEVGFPIAIQIMQHS